MAALSLAALSAQTPDTNAPAGGPPPPPPMGGPGGHMGMGMGKLTDAERAQLKAAHDTAVKQNPVLDQNIKAAWQAMAEARKAMSDAMIQVDPTVAPILEKMRGGHQPPPPPQ